MDLKKFLTEIVPPISTSLNIISMSSGLLVVLLYLMLTFLKPHLINRVSLRLQVGISLFDMINHLFALFHQNRDVSPSFCTFIGFYRSFGNQIYCFLNLCIALNLQLIFLHKLTPNKKWEVGYWSGTLLLAALANFIPLGVGYYGKNSDGLCFVNSDLPYADTVMGVNVNGINIFTFFYCLLVSVLVVIKLVQSMHSLESISLVATTTTQQTSDTRPEMIRQIKKLALRVAIYPTLCFLSLSGFNFRFFLRLGGVDVNSVGLITWSLVGLTTAGFFNLIAFLCDPTLQTALYAVYRENWVRERNNGLDGSNSLNLEEQNSIELDKFKMEDHSPASGQVDQLDPNYYELTKFL